MMEITYTAFHSPLELIAQIEKGMRFDILFLDVLMPGSTELRRHRRSGNMTVP